MKGVGLHPDTSSGPLGAPSLPGSQEPAQVAPHFLRVHARMAVCGTAVVGTSALSQIFHCPSPDLWLGPRPQQENEGAPCPIVDTVTYCSDHAKRLWALGQALGPLEPPVPSLWDEGKERAMAWSHRLPWLNGGGGARLGKGR